MRHYMTIIESRLVGRVQAEITVSPEWLDAVLPKMTIQPIIENAVKYGLEPLDRPGLLRLYTVADDQELHVVIEDNGVGMSPEAAEAMRRSLNARESDGDSQKKGRRGIGLTNVHRRLVLMYGDGYGLNIESKQNIGTTVTITLPLPRKGG
jgi:two-component system sensor histidine kinase YesM